MDAKAAHALIRFGLGRRGAEAVPTDPRAWLARQLDGPDPALAGPGHSGAEGLGAIRASQADKTVKDRRSVIRDIFVADTNTNIDSLLTTVTPFRERLVWFWANHFTVSIKAPFAAAVVNAQFREAIRPHVTGRFADMLLAVMRHPAMLIYLNNAASIGPNSRAGSTQKRGLNENLARECLELHTVTPASGYTQADVTEFARVITGWSTSADAPGTGFIFRPNLHEPGAKTVMGQSFGGGEQGGVDALNWLAAHPATARHLATKLARHFIADTPPAAAIARLEAAFRHSKGDLKATALAVIDAPEAWQPLTKLRSPFDYVIAAIRALDLPATNRPDVAAVLSGLGQPIHNCPGPNGWPDTAADWAAPEAMLRRIDWAYAVATRAPMADPVAVAEASLGPLLPVATRTQIARAGSQREAMTLLLAAPEFQRR